MVHSRGFCRAESLASPGLVPLSLVPEPDATAHKADKAAVCIDRTTLAKRLTWHAELQ